MGRHSSVVEQRFCKPSVLGSNPSAGSQFPPRVFSNPSPNFASKDSVNARKNISSRAPESSKSDTTLDLESGTLLFDVPTLKKESNFKVTTPFGIAGVRGTRFYVNAKKSSAGYRVSE